MPNRLINEVSPYLLQHSGNPVDWFPWSDEAFEKAKKEMKPVFLSIGYSTCHWCHVMGKESFENNEVAAMMNSAFINIKVDREERPDVDSVYMNVCQALTGSGGWPLTIIMTPDKKPFFAATYIPRNSGWGRFGLTELIPKIEHLWKNDKSKLLESAESITSQLFSGMSSNEVPWSLNKDILRTAYLALGNSFDSENGGFGSSPKFPMPHNLSFLLEYYHYFNAQNALKMVEDTVLRIRMGGVYDQLGFGLHRYSTDEKWLVPHFEKMLYDNALYSIASTNCWKITRKEDFRNIAVDTLYYMMNSLLSPEGGFYTAEDADSEGEEGKFYLWRKSEIETILGDKSGEFCRTYNVRTAGNFIEPSLRALNGLNILHFVSYDDFCNRKNVDASVKLLNEARNKRIRPFRDNKIMTDWNGLAIEAFAGAGSAFGEPVFTGIAERTADFIIKNMMSENSELFHCKRGRGGFVGGFLDDYAFFISGLLALYEANSKTDYLDLSVKLTDVMINKFGDEKGGFYLTSSDSSELPVRTKELTDGAMPSGNSVALINLMKLYSLTTNTKYKVIAGKMTEYFSADIRRVPSAFTKFLSGLSMFFESPEVFIVVGRADDDECRETLSIIRKRFSPGSTLIFRDVDDISVVGLLPYLENYAQIGNKTTIYHCRDFVCSFPVNAEEFLASGE